MGTIHLSPGSFGFTKGSDRSGHISSSSRMSGFGDIVRHPVAGIWAMLIRLQARYEMRRHLQQLDDRMLRDIGLTRQQAEGAVNGTFHRL